MTTAFVLGGGGVLGAVEVGMLRALFERDITPDLVLGTSVGALNGALVARRARTLGDRAAHRAVAAGPAQAGREVYGDRPLRTVRRAVSTGTHLLVQAAEAGGSTEEFGDLTFEDLPGAAPGVRGQHRARRRALVRLRAGSSTRCVASAALPGCCRRPRSATSTSSTAAS